VILGNRYKNNNEVRFAVDMFNSKEENYVKGLEMINELYLEALRAP